MVVALKALFGNASNLPEVLLATLRPRKKVRSVREHVEAALEWLRVAQDGGSGSLPACYHLFLGSGLRGWTAPYPEVSGYAVPTLLDAAEVLSRGDLRKRARKLGEWLLGIQAPEGWYQGGVLCEGLGPCVFNTGQIVQGLHRLWTETGDERYREACDRATRWLVTQMAPDGSFRVEDSSIVHTTTPHTYNVRVAWIMTCFAREVGDGSLEAAARSNVRYVRERQERNGWFRDTGLESNEHPGLHEVAYTIEGLLQAGRALGDFDAVRAAEKSADALLRQLQSDGTLGGDYFGKDWKPVLRSNCLTGLCQMALIWLLIHDAGGPERYLDGARRALAFVCSTQDLDTRNESRRGGVAGSYPVNGKYMSWRYPTWAAKFFVDALLLLEKKGGWAASTDYNLGADQRVADHIPW